MSRDEPQDLGAILKELKATTALGQRLEEAEIWEHWPEIAGQELAPHASPIGVRDGTLVVEVESSVWMHKFSYRKFKILDKSNNFLSQEKLSELYFVLKSEDEDPAAKNGA